jgi:tetratricopeptide (TPR) repeat protein
MDAEHAFDVFVSYSHADSHGWVHHWLLPRLVRAGVRPYIDSFHFPPGDKVVQAIIDATERTPFTILVFTPNYLTSDWTKFEREFIANLAVSGGQKALPLLLEKCDIPKPFDMLIHSDFTREELREAQLRKLVARIRGQTPAVIEAADVPIVRSRYRNFDIELSPSGTRQFVLRASCAHLEKAITEVVTMDVDDLARRARVVKRGGADRTAAQDIGVRLYRTLFTPDVVQLWSDAQAVFTNTDEKGVLRLRLRLLDHRVSALPWELLHDGTDHLMMTIQHPLVRISSGNPTPVAPLDRSNVLLIDATAGDATAGDATAGQSGSAELEERLARVAAGGELRVLRTASLSAIQAALRPGTFDMVHLIGEAESPGGTGRLLLRTDAGAALPVDGEMFGYYLRTSPVRLLVMTAAGSATAAGGSLLSAAEGANRAGIAVVAMQGPISKEAANVFSRTFYEVLAEGCPVEACVAQGRIAIMGTVGLDHPQWAFPVLFNDAPDALLFRSTPASYCFGGQIAARPAPRGHEPQSPAEHRIADERAMPLHNLDDTAPPEVTGRDALLGTVRAALAPDALNPVVLLSGAPGTGKTAIVRAITREVLENRLPASFETVVWISPSDPHVARLDDPEHCTFGRISLRGMTTVVLTTMDHRHLLSLNVSSRIREIAALLAYGRHLVVIDDVPPASHDAVRAFIEPMPRTVRFLLTSSQRIGLGELEIEVGPLDDGTYTFIRAAEASRRKKKPLAASSVAEYVAALLPTLSPAARTVLAVCATLPFHAGESIVKAASGLQERPFATARDALLDMHLIKRHAEGQLLLSGTLRSLFRDGDPALRASLPDVSDPCVAAYAAFAKEERKGSAVNRYGPELGNLVWAIQQTYTKGAYADLKSFRMALDDVLFRLALFPLAIGIGELAYLAASRIPDYTEMAWAALHPLGRIHYHRGDFAMSERWCATSLAMFQQQGDAHGIISAQRYLGRVKQSRGDVAGARALFRDMLQRTKKLPDAKPGELGLAQATLAGLEQAEGRIAEAEKLYRRALEIYEPEGKAESIGATYHALGRLYVKRDPQKALDYFHRAEQVLAGTHWTTRKARIAVGIGLAYEEQQKFDEAVLQLRKAREVFAEVGASSELAHVDATLVRLTALRGREGRSTTRETTAGDR